MTRTRPEPPMPLLDHFRPPLSLRRSWEGFHGVWAAALVEHLNAHVLADELYADMQVHVGGPVEVEVDVAALTEAAGGARGTAVATAPAWAPPGTALVAPMRFPDEVEVRVWGTAAGARLVGAVEPVSPANKDRPDTRRAFAAKVANYLSGGVGVVVADVVTNRPANLHNDIVGLLGLGDPFPLAPGGPTYVAAYRPVRRADGGRLEVWRDAVGVGDELPEMPLGLLNLGVVPVDLGGTYAEACRRLRLG